MNTTRRLGIVAALAAAGALSGCVVSVHGDYDHDTAGTRLVGTLGMEDLVAANKSVRLGMSRDEAVGLYPPDLATLRGQTTWNGHAVEEWQVAARLRDGATTFERWLYFVDDALVELNDSSVDWRERPDVRSAWGLD